MNKIQIASIIGLIFFLQQSIVSQSKNENKFLQKIGTIDSIYSKTLKEYRKFYVQLPGNYNPKKKYPVVYILDGGVFLPTVNDVQRYYSGGFTPEMILIGISNATNRTRDLTTSKIDKKYGMPFTEENGEAHNFNKFIGSELIPFVESKYPVTHFRTLIGHSYGGLFVMYTLLNTPDLFTNYLAIDPSLDWDNQKLLSDAQEIFSKKTYNGKSLFMSLNGQLHPQNPIINIENVMQDTSELTLFARANIAFSNMVKHHSKNGLAYKWNFYPNDLHGTIPFPSIMDGLIFNFKWYQMENTNKFNSTNTTKEELSKFVNYRAKKLESHFGYIVPPYPEDLFDALGHMSMDIGDLKKAKMFFEFAIKFYPNNATSYNSMVDFYERSNDYNNALKFATKAFEISDDEYYIQRIKNIKKRINKI
ncbi:alpha/beta hydrolase-fold protein [Tenacibaculum sp. SDUM215027]|uniref:alpha/beta hydrolase-fold protein n=1 Tax=Tenacibaculum sp. SDUM215027 TaxID=3422596 RepID=UPI003D31452A